MLTAYGPTDAGLAPVPAGPEEPSACWIDLLDPGAEEVARVERRAGVPLPSRHTMHEIEQSSRLYAHGSSAYLTVIVLWRSGSDRPALTPVSFVLTDACLVTVRYGDPQSIQAFIRQAASGGPTLHRPDGVLVGLMEAIVDRAADILEEVGGDVIAQSQQVFRPDEDEDTRSTDPTDLERVVRQIGRLQHTAGLAENSLASLSRAVTYLLLLLDTVKADKDLRARAKTLARDVQSLREYVTDLSGKLGFLLDATLGLIDLQQTKVMKVFSVLALVFMPPTLIAGVYGMNFQHMPELGWPWGYPFALVLMIISALVPYALFRRRGWL